MLILNKKNSFKKKLDDVNNLACTSISLVGTAKHMLKYEAWVEDSNVRLSKQMYDYILEWLTQSYKTHNEIIKSIQNLKGEL